MDNKKKQNQHYFPNFYINNFKTENLLYYDEEKGFTKRNPKKIFSEDNYYGDADCYLETEFSKQECESSLIIKKLINSQKDVTLTRKEKNNLSKFLGFLPRRVPSMVKYFSSKEDFIKTIENELKQFENDNQSWKPGILNNNIQQDILKYTMTVWESEYDIPLIPDLIGFNELTNLSTTNHANNPCPDCFSDVMPDFLIFPISNKRLIFFMNQKFTFDNIFNSMLMKGKLNNFKTIDDNLFIKMNDFVEKEYCFRTVFMNMNWMKFIKSVCKQKFVNPEFMKKGFADYSHASLEDEYTYPINKMDYEMYKFIFVTYFIKVSSSENEMNFIVNDKDNFIKTLYEVYSDLKNNLAEESMKEYATDGVVNPKNWYRYQIYKISTKESIEMIEKLIMEYTQYLK